MKLLIVDPGVPGGIYQASVYLNEYLSQFHETEMISLVHDNYKQIEEAVSDHDIIITQDIVIDANKLKYLNKKIVYFFHGFFPYEDDSLLSTYDHVISPMTPFTFGKNKYINDIKWGFNIPCPNSVSDINDRSEDLLYIGRIEALKMSIHFLAQYLKSGYKITIAGNIIRNDEEDDLLAQLLEHENVNYLGQVDHKEALNLMTKHKFCVLASQTDVFCLYILEAIYRGCIPIIERRKYVEYPWVVDSTYKVWNALDIVNVYETLKSLPDNVLQQYRDFHRQQVLDKMNKMSDINIFNYFLSQK